MLDRLFQRENGHQEQHMICIVEILVDLILQKFLVLLILYSATYFVLNEDYRVYECLQNGTNPDNPNGRPSLDQPLFTDLEPRAMLEVVVMDIFGNIFTLLNQVIL